jgi:hypothetical protein
MRSNVVLLLAVVGALGIGVAVDCGNAWAGDAVKGQQVPDAEGRYVVPVEFSNTPDKQAAESPTWGLDGIDPGQVVFTLPPDGAGSPFPKNSEYDYNVELDALANSGDAYFHQLRRNEVNLLVSFASEPTGNCVYQESPVGARSVKWKDRDLVFDDPTVDLLDALEVWGAVRTQPI